MNQQFSVSAGLSRELAVRADKAYRCHAVLDAVQTFSDYATRSNKLHILEQLQAITKGWKPGAKVLDVGFGNGFSSLYLASAGFEVVGVEPSTPDIEIALRAAAKFALPFKAVCSTGEEMGSALKGQRFDFVLFNSSLHHCDDPGKALRAAHDLLNLGGSVVCIEPVLKPWRSKRWYFRRLEIDPVGMGHYGGNEHIYHSWEYAAMLSAAGFNSVRSQPVLALNNPRSVLLNKLQSKTADGYTYSLSGIALRAAYYTATERLFMSCAGTCTFMRLSLGDGIWQGVR